MIRWRSVGVALTVAATLGIAGGVFAQDQDKLAAVKHRQDTMKRQAADLKYISDFAKGVGGDQDNAVYKVQELQFVSGTILSLFPPGTSSADLPGKTYAKPDIWTNWDKFKALIPVLQDAEDNLLVAVQSGDKAKIGPALGNLGKNGCFACHSQFREKMPSQ
jgi:cytochrome c556